MLSRNSTEFERPERDSFTTSLWHNTAIPAQQYLTLVGDKTAEVLVIGAGYTGLSAAIDLAETGKDVVVLEAREPGFGASGRNGGQVIPAFKYDPDRVLQVYGSKAAAAVLDMVSCTADTVFNLIERFNIDCDPVLGWIQAAHNSRSLETVRSRHQQWKARGVPVDILNAEEIKNLTGAGAYLGGIRFRNAGTVQPLSYVRGLANAAATTGARVFCNSPVTQIQKSGQGWCVSTADGCVTTNTLIIATNAYTTSIWPGLRESVVPLYSVQIATDPLPEALRQEVMPVVQSMVDMRRLVCYFRKDRDHRFVIGMRGPFKAKPDVQDVKAVLIAARKIYPALESVAFPYRWSGRVGMTADQVPHLHQLAPGVFTALGYSGRGVGMATMMGKILAQACVSPDKEALPYPVTPLKQIPFHTFHRVGVQAMVNYYRLLDRFH